MPEDTVVVAPVDAIQSLLATVQELKAEVRQLREDREKDKVEFERFKKTHSTFAVQTTNDIDQLFEVVEKKPTVSPRGEKTKARIAKIDEILKARGPTTLKELERLLKIDPATMTRILGRLDKRRYELHDRSGDEREKVLRLKAQIR